MRKILIWYAVMALCGASLYPGEEKPAYGNPGGFELSSGLSISSTSNREFSQNYSIGILPYANHFLLRNFFMRYDLGLAYQYGIQYSSVPQYSGQYSEFWNFSVNPGLGAGYSFALSDKWKFNLSAGYQFGYTWSHTTYFGTTGVGGATLVFNPELKYMITERWIASILMKVFTNFDDMIASPGKNADVSTNGYVVLSYYFP